MAQLIYSAVMSLDSYVADKDGKFGWAEPDEEVHAFFNDLARPVGTHLYGRWMYETMRVWRPTPRWPTIHPLCGTLRTYGRQPARSCTPRRWTRYPLELTRFSG
jgi:hypothetical protein